MALDRPKVPNGFLGAQPTFSELKLQTDSHKDAEFSIGGKNSVIIKLKASDNVKLETKLTHGDSEQELPDHVLIQRKDKSSIDFHVNFPRDGWYQFMIFALEESNPSDSLPNVYNYLINVTNVNHPAQGYGKAFTKSYADCCYLYEPLILNSNFDGLAEVKFKLTVPGASKVAVHCVQEWFPLAKNGDLWEGTANLSPYKGKDSKVKVMSNYENDGSTYNALFEFTI